MSFSWFIVSKYDEISPSIIQKYFLRSWVLQVMHLIASIVQRVGRKPKEYWLKSAS